MMVMMTMIIMIKQRGEKKGGNKSHIVFLVAWPLSHMFPMGNEDMKVENRRMFNRKKRRHIQINAYDCSRGRKEDTHIQERVKEAQPGVTQTGEGKWFKHYCCTARTRSFSTPCEKKKITPPKAVNYFSSLLLKHPRQLPLLVTLPAQMSVLFIPKCLLH